MHQDEVRLVDTIKVEELKMLLDMFCFGFRGILTQKRVEIKVMSMSIVLSCQNTWGVLWENGSLFIIEMGLKMITALKTLKYLLKKIIVEKFCVLTVERSLQ